MNAAHEVEQQRDLVVLSHLRWDWVWQRPQHLVSRFAGWGSTVGSRTWFVEEPKAGNVRAPQIRHEEADGISRVWLEIPKVARQPQALGFDAQGAENYGTLLSAFLAAQGMPPGPQVLLYTPMALELAQALSPSTLAYDVMDDLAAFRNAPEGLRLKQRRLFAAADVLFAGGRSLRDGVSAVTDKTCHLFASGVDTAHYEASRAVRAPAGNRQRVAGYVGVIDERLDLALIRSLAARLPEWVIRVVGPVAKISPRSLPRAANIEYSGMASYAELPKVMAGFDVALMPFALNEATRSISPTKTLEYLAAGLPVVSTRVADVVADYSDVVQFADDGPAFAAACISALEPRDARWHAHVEEYVHRADWDTIAAHMYELLSTAPMHAATRASIPSELSIELEGAHTKAAGAAVAGLSDAALGANRLAGSAVRTLAEAAVSSATPYLRAPLLARLSAALVLHPPAGDIDGMCPTCRVTAPCQTATVLQW